MALVLGKTDIKTITGKVDIYAPADDGRKKKAGRLKVTTKVLPRSEFVALTEASENDKEVARDLIINIEAGDNDTQVPDYDPAFMDDIFEIDWQFNPIFDFVLAANNERVGRALKGKN